MSHAPIVLFCDFGLPYTGQMKGRIVQELGEQASHHPIVDLFHDVPAHDVKAGSVLLAAHAADFPIGSVFVCVVDPGVGSKSRKPGAVFAGGRWFVGPLNGLFEHVLRRCSGDAGEARAFEITWRPEQLSASFHAATCSPHSPRRLPNRVLKQRVWMNWTWIRYAIQSSPMTWPR